MAAERGRSRRRLWLYRTFPRGPGVFLKDRLMGKVNFSRQWAKMSCVIPSG